MEPSIGQALRDARIARGVELSELEAATKIRLRYLRAIEDEDWDALPGAAYARGFIRTYAQFVGLDADALVDEYRRRRERAEMEVPLEPSFEQPAAAGRPLPRRPPWLPLGLAAGALVVFLAILGLVGGSDDGGGPAKRHAAHGQHGQQPQQTTRETTTTAAPARVSLTLAATGPVWVCLVDDSGRQLVDGVTLAAGQREGPFEARRFEMTFGNGQVRMEVDGSAVEVPAASDPLGYEVTSEGASKLGSAARPTCV
jgi:hypothetical protein